MLKETIRKNENVRLFDSLSTEKTAAFLVGGTIRAIRSFTGREILTDGKLKLLSFDSYEVEITEPHWLVFRNDGRLSANVDRDWLNKVSLNESFVKLCLALAMPEVRPIRFYSEEKRIVCGHTCRFISGIILDSGIEPSNFNRLVVFDDKSRYSCDFPFAPSDSKAETYPLDLGLELSLFIKGFLIRD